jgi:predicted double-glycine peptidase
MPRASSRISSCRTSAYRTLRALAACAALLTAADSAQAGTAWIFARGAHPVQLQSIRELRWKGVVRQQRDYTCGAAAVATLLTHHLDTPTPEYNVMINMYVNGDRPVIEKAGFSMLDMIRYMNARGFKADGFRTSLTKLQKERLPAIALLHHRVRDTVVHHYVVIKGVSQDQVFFADSRIGLRVLDRESFQKMLDPVLLVVRSHLELSNKSFEADPTTWSIRRRPSIRAAFELPDLATTALMLPQLNEF